MQRDFYLPRLGRVISFLPQALSPMWISPYIRNNTGTLFHPVGTNSMSRKGSSSGVVDPDLKVKGIEGL